MVRRPAGAQTVWLLHFMLQLPLTFLTFTTHKRTKNLPHLPYHSIFYVGIVQTDGPMRVKPSSKYHHHDGAGFELPHPQETLREGLVEGGIQGV